MPKQRQNREVARSIPFLLTIPIHALIIVLMVCGCVRRVQAAIPASERQALINFYTSTNGSLWTYKTNWLSSSNAFADPGTECTWYGVGCDASNSTVIGISIENNNISGSLPDLSSLTNLQYLDLDQNHISGAIPSLISFSELQDFEAYNNKFSGQIPYLTGLINLQKVDLRNNALSGSIPAFSSLAALQVFEVENNQLTGSIPELAGLTNLSALGVGENNLTGTIPSLDGLTNLQGFFVGSNRLEGNIPSLAEFPNLTEVDFSNNGFTGTLPSLTGLSQLTYFSASNNQLTGSLPSLSGLTNLQYFEVRNNQLTGSIPSLSDLSELQTFYVDSNQISGTLPTAPSSGSASICPNPLTPTPDPAWDKVTGDSPWYRPCVNPPSTVTPTAGANGSISPAVPVVVQSGRTTSFFVLPNPGFVARIGGSCGPTQVLSPTTFSYVTNPVSSDCSVIATFIALPYPTETSLTISPETAVGNQNVTLTSTVSGVSPTGTVTFSIGPTVLCQSVILSSDGIASCSGNFGFPGENQVTAFYNGDSLNASSSAVSSFTYIFQQTVYLSSSNSETFFGQPITFSASIFPYYNPLDTTITGTGTITFSDTGKVLCVVPLVSQKASCTTQSVAAGSRNISATYSGDSADTPASTSITQFVSGSLFVPQLALIANPNPTTVSEGAFLSATVNGLDYPSGSVSFFDNGKLLCDEVLNTQESPTQAICYIPSTAKNALSRGYHPITAVYSGDANHAGVSTSLTLVVGDSLATSQVFFSSSPTISSHGQVVNLVALVAGNAPTGTVTFSISGMNTTCQVALVSVNSSSSSATCSAALDAPGDEVNVDYPGDLNNGSSMAQGYVNVKSATGSFMSIQPFRILDTRAGGLTGDGKFSGGGVLFGGSKMDLQILGRGSLPATNVTSVVLNVTATNPTADGYLTAWPAGQPLPLSSNLNFVPNDTVPNLVVVPVGAKGAVSLYNSAGTTNVVADVVGYFTTGSELNSVSPQRVLDTRAIGHTIDGQFSGVGALTTGGILNLTLQGRGGIANSGAGVAILNVTATNTTKAGYITAFAAGTPRPLASNLNFVANQTIANLVVAPIGSNGQVFFYNSAGSTDLIADLIGWMPTSSQLNPVEPARLMDTRSGAATIDSQFSGNGALSAGGSISLPVLGRAGIPLTGVDSVILNVTATNPTKAGYITVWPTGTPLPTASNLNFVAGQTVPNLVFAKLAADGTVSLYNSAGTTDLVVDVVGWFSTSP